MQDMRPFGADVEAMPEDDDMMTGEEPATEEEQAMYELVVARAMKFAYGAGKDQVLKTLSSGENPADGIGRAASTIVRAIKQSADQAGKPISDDILFHAGIEIVEDLAEFGSKSGIFQYRDEAEEQEQTELALFYAMKYYGEEALASGDITPEDQEAARRAIDEGIAKERQAGSARVGEAVRGAMNEPDVPAGGEGIARKPGMINSAMGG